LFSEVPCRVRGRRGGILRCAAFNGAACPNFYGGAAVDCSATPVRGTPPRVFNPGTPTLTSPFSGGSAVFGIGINHIDHNAKHPYTQQFTLGVQQQFASNWIVSADGLHDFGQRFMLGRLLRSTTSTSPLISCPNGFDP